MFSMTCLAESDGPNLYVFVDSMFDSGHKSAHASGLKSGYMPYGIELMVLEWPVQIHKWEDNSGTYKLEQTKVIQSFLLEITHRYRRPIYM